MLVISDMHHIIAGHIGIFCLIARGFIHRVMPYAVDCCSPVVHLQNLRHAEEMSVVPVILNSIKKVEKGSQTRKVVNMTTINNIGSALGISGALESRIIHDYNNGGVKSTYGLSVYQRKVTIKYLFSQNPKCFCVKCI